MDRNQTLSGCCAVQAVALRKESVDRNLTNILVQREVRLSLSARRAWIEINSFAPSFLFTPVALRKESVDRNLLRCDYTRKGIGVALRKESVDRNKPIACVGSDPNAVALRKESVDRNKTLLTLTHNRAVALRKESVDRNAR